MSTGTCFSQCTLVTLDAHILFSVAELRRQRLLSGNMVNLTGLERDTGSVICHHLACGFNQVALKANSLLSLTLSPGEK